MKVSSFSRALHGGASFAFQGIKIIYFEQHYHFLANLSSIAPFSLFICEAPGKMSWFPLPASLFQIEALLVVSFEFKGLSYSDPCFPEIRAKLLQLNQLDL